MRRDGPSYVGRECSITVGYNALIPQSFAARQSHT